MYLDPELISNKTIFDFENGRDTIFVSSETLRT